MKNEQQKRPFKYAYFKKTNRRIWISVWEDENKETAVMVHTKRLVDRKAREVLETKVLYGISTFLVMREVFNALIDDNEFWDKVNKEINEKINGEKYKCYSNFMGQEKNDIH